MAYGAYTFNTVQLGREATPGTPPASMGSIWRGEFAMVSDTRDRQIIEEQIGLYVSEERVYDAWLGAQVQLPATPLTYEQVPHLLEAGIETVTPSAGPPYTYAYAYPINAAPTVKTYTIEAGNRTITGDNRRMPFAFVTSMKFAGNSKSTWTMESTWMGQQVQSSTLSAAPSLATVEEAVFGNTDLWIDNSGAIGTTQITGTLMAAEINISDTGVREVPTADGTNYYTNIKYTRPSIDFSLTFELENVETAVSTARSKFESDTIQVFQIHVPGSGTSNVKFRFAGRYTDFGDYTNDNGNTSVQVGGRVIYSIADSLFFEMDVINSLATLP